MEVFLLVVIFGFIGLLFVLPLFIQLQKRVKESPWYVVLGVGYIMFLAILLLFIYLIPLLSKLPK